MRSLPHEVQVHVPQEGSKPNWSFSVAPQLGQKYSSIFTPPLFNEGYMKYSVYGNYHITAKRAFQHFTVNIVEQAWREGILPGLLIIYLIII